MARSGRFRIVLDALILVAILVAAGIAFSTEASETAADERPASVSVTSA